MALKDIGKNTPAVEVIRRVLEAQGKPMSLEELSVSVMNTWGRDFPNTPYEQVPLMYKLTTNTLNCDVDFSEIGDSVPIIKREEGAEDEVPLSPELGPGDLNLIVDQLKQVKVALPERE